MSNQSTTPSQEIDLGHVYRQIKVRLSKINDSFFNWILFLKRNIIVVLLLIIAGVALGIYLDRDSKRYKHKVIVVPNFGSIDYLYEEIENINAKVQEGNYNYLGAMGVKNPQSFIHIEIDPVVDIYKFMTKEEEDERNIEVLRILSAKEDISKFIEDKATARNYKNHVITITTRGTGNQLGIVDPILNFFNVTPHLKKMRTEYIKNLDIKIAANDTTIKHIDAILNNFGSPNAKSSHLLSYNDNTELNEIIIRKNKLLEQQEQNRIDRANYTNVVENIGTILNIKDFSATTGRMKYIMPLLFLLGFMFTASFAAYYKRQMAKRQIVNK
jgi:hypothetical protein